MANLTREEKIKRTVRAIQLRHGIDVNGVIGPDGRQNDPVGYWDRLFDAVETREMHKLKIRNEPPVVLSFTVVEPFGSQKDTLYPAKLPWEIREPAYSYILVDVPTTFGRVREYRWVKNKLDLTGWPQLPEMDDLMKFWETLDRGFTPPFEFAYYEGKYFLNPTNRYFIGSKEISRAKFRELLLRLKECKYYGALKWSEYWINELSDSDLDYFYYAYKPSYDYYMSFYFGFDPNA